ncbi:c-type cytochrome [Aneurinibacillus tyrosinisolvens]|uniref:c-type cytochrome n=1 Tax=Aneurinibacillus tyrosinisolvens TaxID=1443435 RepID=UPI00069BA5B1|nr:cytochrome c [Aneurinibacillus tyrosinisolvens]
MKKWIQSISMAMLVLFLVAGCATSSKDNNNAGGQTGNQTGGGTNGGQAGGGKAGGNTGGQNGGQKGDQNGANTAQAQKLYQGKCISCHGGNLEGGMGPSLTKVGSNYSSVDKLQAKIKAGGGGMPAGLVTDAEAKVLAQWLSTHK